MNFVPCGTRVICDSCMKGDHDCAPTSAGLIWDIQCLEHHDPVSCHCWCVAHPDHRDRLMAELLPFGVPDFVSFG